MKVLIPNTIQLDLDVNAEVVEYDVAEPLPPEHCDAEVLIEWGSRPKDIAIRAEQLRNVQFVQTLMAGADAVLRAGFRPEAQIANGVGMHDRTVAEHAMALTLALVRKLPMLAEARREHRWEWSMSMRMPLRTKPVTTLIGTNVLVWGFGSIAKTLAPLLSAFGANVKGAARSAGVREGYEVIAEADLAEELARTDILVMILPDTPATENAFDAERIAQLPDHALLVNVGRGRTVDEAALIAALEDGTLGGAALDVMQKEPLPAESPLWDAPNIILTPHSAGGRPIGAGELVSAQVAALQAGEPLRNVVAR